MASAMSPEMQTLQALEKESASFLEIDTKIQTLNKKHFRLFEVLKRDQHERLLEVSCILSWTKLKHMMSPSAFS